MSNMLKKLARKLGVKVSEKDELAIGLRDLGVKLFSDGKLDTRLQIIAEILEKFEEPLFERYVKEGDRILKRNREPIEVISEMKRRTRLLNELLNTVSFPWGRSLENRVFANLVKAWNDLYAFAKQTIRDVERILTFKERETDRREIVELLANFLINYVWNIGLTIVGSAFTKADVSPIYVVVQQSQSPFYSGYIPIIERSRLPKAEQPPEDRPIPPRIKDEV